MNDIRIGIIGIGYVGLPLLAEFSKFYDTIGYDIDLNRINELKDGVDRTKELDNSFLKKNKLNITAKISDLNKCNVYVITVPTPIDNNKNPLLKPLLEASKSVGNLLNKGDIVIYESTVYPGCTEDDCVPVLEKNSGLKYNKDFFCGYSPERINPGDKKNTLTKILKLTSGSNVKTANFVNQLYKKIISAGTFQTSSIKVAEAAKVIENSQRDINIAFVNELDRIFSLMDIPTDEVLEAASTKWNFINFRPGLVGGHCIGVDPYYLAQKAQEFGYHSEIILAGRRMNDTMAIWLAQKIIKLMINNKKNIHGSRILVFGITFKENCPDTRNTKVIDLINELSSYGCVVDVFDNVADPVEVKNNFDIDLVKSYENKYDSVILAVAHDFFKNINPYETYGSNCLVYDIKGGWKKYKKIDQ